MFAIQPKSDRLLESFLKILFKKLLTSYRLFVYMAIALLTFNILNSLGEVMVCWLFQSPFNTSFDRWEMGVGGLSEEWVHRMDINILSLQHWTY